MITIRTATIEDIYAITLLLADLGYPATADEVRLRFKNISQNSDYKTLLALAGEEVTGMIGMSKNYFYEHNGEYIRILVMVVNQTHRNEGIGRRLLQEAEDWAKEIGANAIVLNSGNRPERMGAYAFYQKMGFEIRSSGFIKKM